MRPIPWLASLALGLALPAFAADINVTTTADGNDVMPGDGVCNDGTAQCTLRAAIQTANLLAGPDDVILPAGLLELSLRRDTDLPDPQTGDLDVTSDITVVGAGNATPCEGVGCTCIDGKGGKDRIFDVAVGGTLRLEQLIVKNGKAAKGDLNPVQFEEISGGCIRVAGMLETEDVVIQRCSSPDDGGCIGFIDGSTGSLEKTFIDGCKTKDAGGGIEVDASDVDLDQVTIRGGKASDEGGAVELSGGTLDVANGTFSGNSAGEGGGIEAESGAIVTLNNSTFVNNKAKDGAAIRNDGNSASIEISNSLLRTGSKENNCGGSITSEGGNLENGVLCNFSFGAGDCPDCDPGVVEELADNGGPVPTHALDFDSQAISLGQNASCEATDARGAARVGNCDAGSFEFGGVVP